MLLVLDGGEAGGAHGGLYAGQQIVHGVGGVDAFGAKTGNAPSVHFD